MWANNRTQCKYETLAVKRTIDGTKKKKTAIATKS